MFNSQKEHARYSHYTYICFYFYILHLNMIMINIMSITGGGNFCLPTDRVSQSTKITSSQALINMTILIFNDND